MSGDLASDIASRSEFDSVPLADFLRAIMAHGEAVRTIQSVREAVIRHRAWYPRSNGPMGHLLNDLEKVLGIDAP